MIISPGQSASLVSPPDNSTKEPFPLAQGEPDDLSRLLDAFAKSYYSAVMWDLNYDTSNAFASQHTVEYLTDTMNAATGNDTITPDAILGSPDMTGSPAQFEVQYICSVPRKKDTGSLIISVLVSNIVLLSVFWSLFNWITVRYLKRRDPTWNLCAGCLDHNAPRLRLQTSAHIMKMDQDPLCQNVDLDQDTFYSSYPGQDLKDWDRLEVAKSVSTKSSQRTLRAGSEGSLQTRNDSLKKYVRIS